jgi:predicted nucleic acid-binding Zn ribbon protein
MTEATGTVYDESSYTDANRNRKCLVCGTAFYAIHPGQKFCSSAHRKAFARRQRARPPTAV